MMERDANGVMDLAGGVQGGHVRRKNSGGLVPWDWADSIDRAKVHYGRKRTRRSVFVAIHKRETRLAEGGTRDNICICLRPRTEKARDRSRLRNRVHSCL